MRTQSTAHVESKRAEVVVDGDAIELRYLAAGPAEANESPIVLLHGIGLDAAGVSWKHLLPQLGREHAVLAPDLPGHGESDAPDIAYTTDYYRDTLQAFLASLDVESVRLVGISMGGALALGHALDGGQVEGLVLVDSYGLGRDAPWRPGGYGLLRVPGFDQFLSAGFRLNPAAVAGSLASLTVATSPEFVADVQRTVTPNSLQALARWQRDEFRASGLRTCYRDRLGELDIPTLLVHGREDPIFPVAWSERAAKRIPTARCEVIEQCGHWPPRERPEKFNRVVSEFL
ncbi:alpha/beta fold hydrolase [Halococcus saccharolyticus]|uniref:Alpha/beta hydrolase fold protein n=1 Tax=Halococcus saccharolyticus DSM 5350 TaxID=1227455 RepID=M0MAQ9_9EURY|nr:alpha/beta hydrolase [Halococcus saccharolyticus]EMA42836.1 alpha/beta hydrolase fold protein [Halococcus saccharolyticus DSM 5350]